MIPPYYGLVYSLDSVVRDHLILIFGVDICGGLKEGLDLIGQFALVSSLKLVEFLN
jgi:hypothetical protein